MSAALQSYIAIGDSFTEGVGDWVGPDQPRGWADRVAEGLANDLALRESESFQYANLAIRGRKLRPLIEEQLDVAIGQSPDLISINGGGNDILRPGFQVDQAADILIDAVRRISDSGIHVLLLAGPDPSANLPMGKTFNRRADEFTEQMKARAEGTERVILVDNFNDSGFEDTTYWSEDGLHLSPAGHLRVAANCLDALGVAYPEAWGDPRSPEPDPKSYRSLGYLGQYVGPWIGRRLTGRSSGDGRSAKRPLLTPLNTAG